jgi:hypothetical protein
VLSHHFCREVKARANIYIVWNVRNYLFCDLIGPSQILGIVMNAGIRMSPDLPLLRVKVWLVILGGGGETRSRVAHKS